MKNYNHKKMTMTSLINDLQAVTGAEFEEIRRVLIEHKVPHSYAAYRYLINLGEDVVDEQQKSMLEIENLKIERIRLEENEGSEYLKQQNTHKLMKVRGKVEAGQRINMLIKYFIQDIIRKMDKEVDFIDKTEKSEYKNIGWLLRKKVKKVSYLKRFDVKV